MWKPKDKIHANLRSRVQAVEIADDSRDCCGDGVGRSIQKGRQVIYYIIENPNVLLYGQIQITKDREKDNSNKNTNFHKSSFWR